MGLRHFLFSTPYPFTLGMRTALLQVDRRGIDYLYGITTVSPVCYLLCHIHAAPGTVQQS